MPLSFGSAINTAATTNPQNSSEQAPKAYLCVLFFNERFEFQRQNSWVIPVSLKKKKCTVARKKPLTLIALVLASFSLFGQDSSLAIDVLLTKNVLEYESDFVVTVNIQSMASGQITIASDPLITDYSSDSGDIRLILYQVTDSCFERRVVHTDYFSFDMGRPRQILNPSASLVKQFDMRNIYYLSSEYYRLQVFYRYKSPNKLQEAKSKWIYFFVPSDKNVKAKRNRV